MFLISRIQKIAKGTSFVQSTNGLGQQRSTVENQKLRAKRFVQRSGWDMIENGYAIDWRVSEQVRRFRNECSMGGDSNYSLRPGAATRGRSVCQRRSSADQIIDERDGATFHIADHEVSADHVLATALFNKTAGHRSPQPA